MEFVDILVQGGGFVLGGAAMWVASELRTNSKEHQQLMKGLEEHVKYDEKILSELNRKLDDVERVLKSKL